MIRWAFSLLALACATSAFAGEADVIAATAQQDMRGTWTVSATILHADAGWEHYADRFDVLDEDGNLLGSRTLFHPHVDEQPFTRSLSGVKIPAGVDRVTVRAHDKVDGWGGAEVSVEIPR